MKNKTRRILTKYGDIREIINNFNRVLFYISLFCVIFLVGLMVTVWGNLSKAQDDPETIEEAIQRIVQEHNDEPTAHTADNQSIGLHRVNDILDHPEGSVLGDKFTNADFVIQPLFENTTIYSKSASGLTFGLGAVRLDTSTTINTLRFLFASGQYSHTYVRDDKMATFQCSASINNDSTVLAYFGLGGFGLFAEPPGFGFKIHNGALYAVASFWGAVDFEEVTSQILGVTVTQKHYYRVQVMPAEGVAIYYIDGTEVARLDIPANEDYGLVLFDLDIKNLAAVQRILNIAHIYVSITTD